MAMLRILSMGRVPRNEEGEYGRGSLPRQLEGANAWPRVAIERERAPLNRWKRPATPSRLAFRLARKRPHMKRYLPFAIILAAFLVAVGAGTLLFHFRQAPLLPAKPAFGKPGAEPSHRRGPANAPVELEEFGDFEC